MRGTHGFRPRGGGLPVREEESGQELSLVVTKKVRSMRTKRQARECVQHRPGGYRREGSQCAGPELP